MKNKKELILNIFCFLRFKIQAYITLIALWFLAFISVYKWDNQFFMALLAVIGICIATSQTIFSYLPLLDGEENGKTLETLRKSGEHFLGAALWMSISLLVLYVDLQIKKLYGLYYWFNTIDFVLKLIVLLNFITSAYSINKGLHRVGYIIWWKVDI